MSDLGTSPRVAIILVNWNNDHDTLACVDSLKQSTFKTFDIIIVDNGSRVDSVQRLKARQNEYYLMLSEQNTGYTGGNNLGIAHAMSLGVDFVFLLNNDTLIAETALATLVEAMRQDPQVGVVTPKIFFHPDRHVLWAAGTSFNQGILMGKNLGYLSEDCAAYNRRAYLDYAVGCALLIRREVVETVGTLTADYFCHYEDVDYGLRVNRRGYKILYEPSAIVWHKESASTGGRDNPYIVYYQTRSAFVFRHRWSQSTRHSVESHSYYLAYCAARICRFLGRGNFRGIAAIFLAIADALRGRLGRREYQVLSKKRG